MIGPVGAIMHGLAAVRQGARRLDDAAAAASTAFLPMEGRGEVPDLPGALADMMLAKHEIALGARVVARASEAGDSLLDILA
jgi:hypothetical protein